MTEKAKLKWEYDLLLMEEKQYKHTKHYLNETRKMRHDFRQHILVMNNYLKSGETDKLSKYIGEFVNKIDNQHKNYCANLAVAAIIAYYVDIAETQHTIIKQTIILPKELPFKEVDICVLFGNLFENSLQAVANLPIKERKIYVKAGIINNEILAINIKNPYKDKIIFDKKGIPTNKKTNHGIGLKSVISTIEQYDGSYEITTNDNEFTVSLIMYVK